MPTATIQTMRIATEKTKLNFSTDHGSTRRTVSRARRGPLTVGAPGAGRGGAVATAERPPGPPGPPGPFAPTGPAGPLASGIARPGRAPWTPSGEVPPAGGRPRPGTSLMYQILPSASPAPRQGT